MTAYPPGQRPNHNTRRIGVEVVVAAEYVVMVGTPEPVRRAIAHAGSDLLYEAILNPDTDPTGFLNFSATHEYDLRIDAYRCTMVLEVSEVQRSITGAHRPEYELPEPRRGIES